MVIRSKSTARLPVVDFEPTFRAGRINRTRQNEYMKKSRITTALFFSFTRGVSLNFHADLFSILHADLFPDLAPVIDILIFLIGLPADTFCTQLTEFDIIGEGGLHRIVFDVLNSFIEI